MATADHLCNLTLLIIARLQLTTCALFPFSLSHGPTVDEAAQAIAHLHNQRLAGSVMPLVVRFADSQEQKAKKAARQAKRERQVRYMSSGHYGMSPPLHEVSSFTSHGSTQHMGSPGYYSPVHASGESPSGC